jgi:hypothetical protein
VTSDPTQTVDPDEEITYEQWGVDFFREAISEQRVLGAVHTIAGQAVDIGPTSAGPGGIAAVRAYGVIGQAIATRLRGERISYRVLVPVDLTFELDLQVEKQRFDAELLVPLTLTAVAHRGVRIFIEATPPTGDEISVELKAKGLRASVVQRVGNVEGELRRFVARYVALELDKPHVRAARVIDVSPAIDEVWASIGPRPDEGATTALDGSAERVHRDAVEP